MDVGTFGDTIGLAQTRTQAGLKDTVRRLASGLRVQTAADDPSGLAIAESLQAQASGFDRASQNVQDARNALNVADGALATITAILQRMRTLVVEDHSDLVSPSDKANLQAEVDQLRAEIDRVSENTTFNGKHLLDGSASSKTPQSARVVIEQNDTIANGTKVLDTTTDTLQQQPSVNPSQYPAYIIFNISAYDSVANQLQLDVTIDSQDPNFGPRQTSSYSSANGDGIVPGTDYPVGGSPPTPGTPTFTEFDQNFNPIVSYNIGILGTGDVGKQAAIIIVPQQSAVPGAALSIHDGSNEGQAVAVDITATNSQNLGVNSIVLGDSITDDANEYKIDYALQTITAQRAALGAQTVSLQEDQRADQVAAVNLQAAESNVRDANVAKELSSFVRDQVLVTVQTSLFSQVGVHAHDVLTLFR